MTRKVRKIDPSTASPPPTVSPPTDAAPRPAGQLAFDVGVAGTIKLLKELPAKNADG